MDEQKKKMLMIGGVVALAVVIIIAAAAMMDHKKKIEQSPIIFNRGSSGTPVSTLATTGTTTIPATTTAGVTNPATTTAGVTNPATTTAGVTNPATTTAGVTTIPATTTAGVITIPATTTAEVITIPTPTVPKQKYYIQSTPTTGSYYLKCKFGEKLGTTKVLSEATQVTFSQCDIQNCLMIGEDNVKINRGGGIASDGEFTIYIHSLTGPSYLGLLGHGAYLDLASNPIGFTPISISTASIWNVIPVNDIPVK